MEDTKTNENLMMAYINGDQAAFRELFRRHAPALMGMFRRSLRNEAEAQDLVQQTFLHLHRARFDYRPSSPLKPWLMTIGRNVLRDFVTRTYRTKEVGTPMEILEQHPEAHRSKWLEERSHVGAALQQLQPAQRDLLESVWFDGRSFEELGAAVGKSGVAMRVRAHRAMAKLRALLTDSAQALVTPSGLTGRLGQTFA